ncbi:sulfotransferase domain-containing protein [Streptomyces sp. 4N509B]|uniref:sulfotransferase domain-containing protein n=1 Tax=Streptomyces sp. 4N509B TaxID=3457413 RepID=UPI003FD01D57
MNRELTPVYVPQRPYRCYFTDSTVWDAYEPRPGDIVISTPAKVGTTWTQRIVSVLVFQQPRLAAPLWEVSPWLDSTFVPGAEMFDGLAAQRHRRFIKTHLPMDALPIYAEVSYVVVGRDLRDAAVSTHHHAVGLNDGGITFVAPTGEEVYTPEQPLVSPDLHTYWRDYFTRSPFPWETNGWPYNSPTHHLTSWWGIRQSPNVILLHYQDMLDDLDGQMRRLSAFLGIPVDESRWPELVTACTFADMKARKEETIPDGLGAALGFEFFHKGRNGQWRGLVDEEELALYEETMARLPADLRAWLARSA